MRCQTLVEAKPPNRSAVKCAQSVWLYFNGNPVRAKPKNESATGYGRCGGTARIARRPPHRAYSRRAARDATRRIRLRTNQRIECVPKKPNVPKMKLSSTR